MSELHTLIDRRDDLLAKIREIEATCEGIENEHNAQRVQELNLEQAQLSGTGIDRILEAIKKQRWYFF